MPGLIPKGFDPGADCTDCSTLLADTPARMQVLFTGIKQLDPDRDVDDVTVTLEQIIGFPCQYTFTDPTIPQIYTLLLGKQPPNQSSTLAVATFGGFQLTFSGIADGPCIINGTAQNNFTREVPSPVGFFGGRADWAPA